MQSSQKRTKLRSGISSAREFLSRKAALQLHAVPLEGYTPTFSDTSHLHFELSSITQTK